MFLVVFIVLFAGNEYRTGFIKNIANQMRHRWELVIGKLLSTAVFVAVMLFMAVIAVMLGLPLVMETNVTFPEVMKFIILKFSISANRGTALTNTVSTICKIPAATNIPVIRLATVFWNR